MAASFPMKHLFLPLKVFALLLALLSVACFARAEDIKSIHPTGYVTDLAGVIAPDTKAQLEALCTEVEQKTWRADCGRDGPFHR